MANPDVVELERAPRPGLIFTAAEISVAYVQIGKTGSMAVKEALWRAIDRARGVETFAGSANVKPGPWIRLGKLSARQEAEALERETFTVLRDPLTRYWAAFRDKIHNNPGQLHVRMMERYRLPDDADASTFALSLAADDDVQDRHFARQADLVDGIRVDRFFRIERADELQAYLVDRVGFPLGARHSSRAGAPVLTAEAEAALRAFYAADYELIERAAPL